MPERVLPVQSADRLEVLDVLRGTAIFGILIANIMVVSGYFMLEDAARAALPTAELDGTVDFLVRMLLEGKFYSIFSLLFGYGFAVQMVRASRKNLDFVPLFRRRLLGLALIGLAHAVLLWYGDILLLYALLGLLLIKFRESSDRTLIRVAVGCLVLPVAVYLLMMLTGVGDLLAAPVASTPTPPPPNDFMASIMAAFREGTWFEAFRANLFGVAGRWMDLFISVRFPKVFGMFLIGFLLGRRGFGADPAQDGGVMQRVLVVGLVVGLPTSAVMSWLEGMEVYLPASPLGLAQVVAATIGVPMLALAYAAGVALAYRSRAGQRVLRWLAPAGRMALTNYLMHSAIMVVMFYGWGLGWYGSMGPATTTPIALGICALQVPLSHWWLSRYQYGPVEWLWRQFTYRQRLPIRKARTA